MLFEFGAISFVHGETLSVEFWDFQINIMDLAMQAKPPSERAVT
jgi:hypothetical protein